MLGFLGDALGAIVSGGTTGLLGAGISLVGELKKQKMIFDHDERMEDLKQKGMQLEASLKMDIAKTEGAVKIDLSEMQSFSQSQINDKASYSDPTKMGAIGRFFMGMVDFFRGMIRPSITIYMAVLTTLIYKELMDMVGGLEGVIDKDMALSLVQQVILVVLYITSTVILWWFGTRQKIIQKPSS